MGNMQDTMKHCSAEYGDGMIREDALADPADVHNVQEEDDMNAIMRHGKKRKVTQAVGKKNDLSSRLRQRARTGATAGTGPHTKKQQGCDTARTAINKDVDLWQMLSPLGKGGRHVGIIPQLVSQFDGSRSKNATASAYLCSPHTDHIATDFQDLGWGCGYRNCQMLMTYLERQHEQGIPLLRHVLDIAGLQRLLEQAWKEGFDPQGAAQLKHRVYGTRKWIGTTDVYCMLVFLGVRCTIIDFDRPSGPGNSHDVMFDWIQSYFNPSSSAFENAGVHVTDRPPLYLQHSGHSRTVIGIELLKDGNRNLIMFDPGRRMLRSSSGLPPPPTHAESDMDESELTSSVDESDEANDKPHGRRRSLRIIAQQNPERTVPATLLRPFRVDAKTIARHRQYQLLVLGEVIDDRDRRPDGKVSWNPSQSYLLGEREREVMKKVTSIRAL